MSEDLVERLERLALKMEALGTYDDWHRVVCEAADEIERLRAILRIAAEMPCPYVCTSDEGTAYCSLGVA